jgi:hypothetical protein
MADELRSPENNPTPAQAQFSTDASQISAVYTNFCRVSVTPEELVLDFGLNTQMTPTANAETVKLSHRIVMNFYTAKRLLGALMNVVQAHEVSFGALELDFQKRMRGGRPAMQTGIKS